MKGFRSPRPLRAHPLRVDRHCHGSGVQRARGDEEAADEEALGGVRVGGSWGQATGCGGTHVLMCWAWALFGVGLASGSPRAAAYLLAPGFRRLKMARATTNTFTLPSFAAPGFRRMKVTRATTSIMVVVAAAVVVTNLRVEEKEVVDLMKSFKSTPQVSK